jgi:glycosyltransferase involved in cell wall biosynthesis
LIKGLGLGGAETLLLNAAPHFDRQRFHYTIGYLLPWKDALCDPLRKSGLDVRCFNITSGLSPLGFGRLWRHLRQERYDILHMHLPIPGVYGRLAGRLAGIPGLIYTEHNLWPRLRPVSRFLNRLTFRLNHAAVAVSNEVRDSIRATSPTAVTIENGIDCDAIVIDPDARREIRRELAISDDEIVIVKVANLTEKKNHELLLTAFQSVLKKFPQSRLLLVGQFADRYTHLVSLAQSLGISSRVTFTGPRSDVPRVLQATDIFSMSSRFEGMPIALLEAMAHGLPSVCTAVGGVPDVIRDGTDGYLVPPGDHETLADRLLLLCRDEDRRTRMGCAAADRIHLSFDISRMVRRVEAVYEGVLAGR